MLLTPTNVKCRRIAIAAGSFSPRCLRARDSEGSDERSDCSPGHSVPESPVNIMAIERNRFAVDDLADDGTARSRGP